MCLLVKLPPKGLGFCKRIQSREKEERKKRIRGERGRQRGKDKFCFYIVADVKFKVQG